MNAMRPCEQLTSGVIELFFYGELPSDEREAVESHLGTCRECKHALEELTLIRSALSARSAVSAPPNGDWRSFMAKLDDAVRLEDRRREATVVPFGRRVAAPPAPARARRLPWLAAAAALALATSVLVYQLGNRAVEPTRIADSGAADPAPDQPAPRPAVTAPAADDSRVTQAALARLGEQHFERSKLVVLGLASKDARRVTLTDWEFERELASSLLTDTRLYRMTAEEHGMKALADVMGDLELVLLQASLAERSDPDDLEQIQRLIRKRNLVTRMDTAAATSAGL